MNFKKNKLNMNMKNLLKVNNKLIMNRNNKIDNKMKKYKTNNNSKLRLCKILFLIQI